MAVIKLTDAIIRGLPLGSGIYRDKGCAGLMVICHKTTRTFACQTDLRRDGRFVKTLRIKLDRCDRITLRDARVRAKALLSRIQAGEDPTSGPAVTGITLQGALDTHLDENGLRPRTGESYRYTVDKYLARFRRRAVADISRQDVRDLYGELRAKSGDTTAAGAMRVLRALVTTARRIDESLGSNPVDCLKLPSPKSRKVAPLDLKDWWERVQVLSPVRRDLHISMLLTGGRRTSLVRTRREDVDVLSGVLTFTHMKVGDEPLLFPMGVRLSVLLSARMKEDVPLASEWLWPSPTSRSGHIEEPKEAGLPSPHAYRHIARNLLIAAGVPYAESALLLGQKLPGASGGYMHPQHLVEHLRPYAQALEDLVFGTIFEQSSEERPAEDLAEPLGFVLVEPAPERLLLSAG